MSLEFQATKNRIAMLVNQALSAIENRATDLNWHQKVQSVASQLDLLEKSIQSRKTNIGHFGQMEARKLGSQGAFRARQSATSRIANMDSLERAVQEAFGKIGRQLQKVAKLSPFEDKTAHDLINMLADEIASYEQLLTKVDALAKEMAAAKTNTHISVSHTSMMQRDISSLKTQAMNSPSGPSALMMLALILRLGAMLVASRK